jgi:sulfate/thiosulfate transport system permease protein
LRSVRPNALAFAALGIVVLVLTVLIVLPLVSVALEAFGGGTGAFVSLAADPGVRGAIVLSILATVVSVACNAAFGLLAGWTIAKYRFPGKPLLVTAIDAPLTVSPVIVGLAVLAAFGAKTPAGAWFEAHGLRIAFAPAGIVIATTLITFPYVARAVIAQMTEQGRELEEAAIGLGASAWQAFWHITFPVSRASFLNGLLVCNARAIGEFGAVSVVSGNISGLTQTVPLQISNFYDNANTPQAFGLAAGLALVTIILALAARTLARRGSPAKGRPA